MIGLAGRCPTMRRPRNSVEHVPYRRPRRDARLRRGAGVTSTAGQWFTVGQALGILPADEAGRLRGGRRAGRTVRLGFFDDDDLAERARRAGFELAVAHDLFVHHFGSRTFAATGSTPRRCSTRTRRGSRPSGGMRRLTAAGCAPALGGIRSFTQRRKAAAKAQRRNGRKVIACPMRSRLCVSA